MKYVLMIFMDEQGWVTKSEAEQQASMEGYYTFHGELMQSGAYVYGEALSDSTTATVVRVQEDGTTMTIDGPYAETKEMIAGFYVVEAENLDEAIAWAARIPDARGGAIEVRPVMVWNEEQQQRLEDAGR